MEQDEIVSLTFVASASPYHKGDIAGFDAKTAEAYVKAGVAEPTDPKLLKAAKKD